MASAAVRAQCGIDQNAPGRGDHVDGGDHIMCGLLDHLNTVARRVRAAHVRQKAVWQSVAVRFILLAHGAFAWGTNQPTPRVAEALP
jgi:hypothetical protein